MGTRHYLRSKVDKAAFAVFVLGGIANFAYEDFVIGHYVRRERATYGSCYIGFMIFCTLQVYWNLYFVVKADNRVLRKAVANEKVCELCNCAILSRAHHCKRCDACILDRDHHCWFAGNCIGRNNRRHFYVLTVYLWLGAYVENIYNLQFVCDVLGCNFVSFMTVCLPHFPVFIRSYQPIVIFFNFMTFLGLLLLIMFTMLLYQQTGLLITNSTSYEKTTGVNKQPLTPGLMISNISSVLGSRWYLPFICPLLGRTPKVSTD